MPDDNPFMAGAVHGQGEADAVVNGDAEQSRVPPDVRSRSLQSVCDLDREG
jgi:uncharacterized protein (UPF0210 family)